jgi:D-glycero-D-manno-heptose 1,7-bisphosphate phosphatase
MSTRRAVFLDRDGVLNRAFRDGSGTLRPPSSLDDFELLDGAAEACARLRAAGFALVVATNQPDVARGTQRREVVEQINATLRRELPLDAVFTCYHDDKDDCTCRKPLPGMLLAAAEELGILLEESFMVGDRGRDVEAGRRAGCRTVLVGAERADADFRAPSLLDSVHWILEAAA